MFRVTIVSLDAALAESLCAAAVGAGFDVRVETAFSEAYEPDPAAAPDILTLDLRDGGIRGRSLYTEAWPDAHRLGVVTLAQVGQVDPATGLEDFLVLPAQPAEFAARLQQILWRHGRAAAGNTLAAGDLVVDLTNYQVFQGGRPAALTYKEFELLRFLMTHAQTVFTREILLNRVWGYNYYGGSRTVDVHIRRLRSKLDDDKHGYIETVRNVGYRFTKPLR